MKTHMVVTDLDGTLLRSDRTLSPEDLGTLEKLGEEKVVRVIATGRSLYSCHRVLSDDFPIDYLVFSSGAGILNWPDKKLLVSHCMNEEEIQKAIQVILQLPVDFCIQEPIPRSHYFTYYTKNKSNSDLDARCKLYQSYCKKEENTSHLPQVACQVLVIEPPTTRSYFTQIKKELSKYNVFLTTSPLDQCSRWIEIFPLKSSKHLAAEWIAKKEKIRPDNIMAIGNDYNDKGLLEWAHTAFVVANGPKELRNNHSVVHSNDQNGFTLAITKWKRGNV